MDLSKFINSENFKTICDVSIDQSNINQIRQYKNRDVIFCKTDFISSLFQELRNDKNSYILITHQSDYEINESNFNLKPKCIKKWFAQNVNYKNENLIPIPIGLENHCGASKGPFIDLHTLEDYQIEEEYNKENLLYSNFNINTHHSRVNWLKRIQSLNLEISERKTFSNYINDLKRSYFSASPRGNGIDCHRTWESLYYNCIPIVPKHFSYDSFDAPIIQIENELELTNSFLENKKNEILSQKKFENKKILTIDFWHDLILKHKTQL